MSMTHAAASMSSGQVRDAAISAEEAGQAPAVPPGGTVTSAPASATTTPAPLANASVPVGSEPPPPPAISLVPKTTPATPAPAPAPPPPEPAPAAAPAPAPAPEPVPEPAPAADPAADGAALTGNHQTGKASWYDTSPGPCARTTASRGTTVYVTNLDTGVSTTCRVADYGPQVPGRVIDLSRTTFSELADPRQGVVPVSVDW